MKRCCLAGAITILLLGQVLSSPAASQETTSGQAASGKISASMFGFTEGGPYYHYSRWPSIGVTHRTSKFAGSVKSFGVLESFRDDFTGETALAFEFPANSGINYLWQATLWIGGILGEDTLVSSGHSLYGSYDREFYPPDNPNTGKAIAPSDIGLGTTYRVHYVDTFTANVPNFSYDHFPLNLSIVQKSYSVDVDPYRDIMLLDFIISNIGTEPIKRVYVGILVDGDVCSKKDDYGTCWEDDLTGSLREISTGYIIDNDGNPRGGLFQDSLSPIDALVLRPIMIYPPVSDTNYNWWFNGWSSPEWDFGPRLRSTPDDPFRDFGTGGLGMPEGDENGYYILSHREWDYDQLMTATIDSIDSLWLYPDQSVAPDFSDGYDARFLLSVGPVDLLPDSSMRAVFALFGADFVHIDPANKINLLWEKYHTFYNNLHFDILRQTADRAVNFAHTIIDQMRPPTGLKVVRMSADTAVLTWDNWVLPEVTGYNIYVKPVKNDCFLASKVVIPGVAPDFTGSSVYRFPAGITSGVITGLQLGQLYFAAIVHETESGEGELSKPVVVGYHNLALQVPSVQTHNEYVFFQETDSTATLTWEQSENPRIAYYRIYKTLDPAVAADRYYPFVTDDSSLFSNAPTACREVDGVTYCYYEMRPYDSTNSNVAYYTDRVPISGAMYWLSAVGHSGYQSRFSTIITTDKIVSPIKELVIVLGSTPTEEDYVRSDSLDDYYTRLLDGYPFDIYNWWDTNLILANCPSGYCTDWLDLAGYEVILVEEFPAPKILSRETEPVHKLLTRLLNSGRDVVYFGTPPGNEYVGLSYRVDTIVYDSTSFEARYFNLDSTVLKSWEINYKALDAVDSLAGFDGAVPMKEGLPQLVLDTTHNRFKRWIQQAFYIDNILPLTSAFHTNQNAEVLYRYNSRYPTTSELHGLPCGVLSRHGSAKAYVFSFHLWAMEENLARQLIDYIIARSTDDDADDNPPLFPQTVCLHQNYPNPFNAATKISFELSGQSQVTLEIYNILGQRVCALLDENKPPGYYTVEWNSRDGMGRAVASGVYFYLFRTNNTSITKKMLLLK